MPGRTAAFLAVWLCLVPRSHCMFAVAAATTDKVVELVMVAVKAVVVSLVVLNGETAYSVMATMIRNRPDMMLVLMV